MQLICLKRLVIGVIFLSIVTFKEIPISKSIPCSNTSRIGVKTRTGTFCFVQCFLNNVFRHGDFFSALLKSNPSILNEWSAKLWSRFFCLSVYITMYLNDHQRKTFYAALGLDSTIFNQHVIVETNRTTARVFPAVPDVEHPDFFPKMDRLVELNTQVVEIGKFTFLKQG